MRATMCLSAAGAQPLAPNATAAPALWWASQGGVNPVRANAPPVTAPCRGCHARDLLKPCISTAPQHGFGTDKIQPNCAYPAHEGSVIQTPCH